MKILNIMHQLLKRNMFKTIIDVAKEMSSEAFNDQLDVSSILDKAEQSYLKFHRNLN